MTDLTPITFADTDIEKIAAHTGRVAVFLEPEGRLDAGARRVNRLTKGALARLVEGETFAKSKAGHAQTLAYPAGMAAEAVDVVHMPRRASVAEARKAGAALAKLRGKADLLALAGGMNRVAELVFGLAMRDYAYEDQKSSPKPREGAVSVMCSKPEEAEAAAAPLLAVAEAPS